MRTVRNIISHLLIPSERNQFRARLLHLDSLTAYLAVIFLFVFAFRFTSVANNGQVLGIARDIKIETLLQETNNERKNHGLPELSYSPKLAKAAELKAQDMFDHNYWAHYGPDGKTPWDFILKAQYQYEYAGENLAKNFMFSDQVVSGWMKSPTHRDNILRKEFTQIGFAIRNGSLNGEETTLVVQMFGTPLPSELGGVPEPVSQLPAPASDVLSETSDQSAAPLFSLYASYLFIGLLIFALISDLYAISRIDVTRLHGKNAAHLIFLLAMFIGITFFISKGVIL